MSYQKIIHYCAYVILAIPAIPPVLFPIFEPYTFGKTLLFELIVEAMALVWILFPKQGRTSLTPTNKALGVLMLAFMTSTIFATNVSASFWGSSARMDGFFTLLHFVIFFIILATAFGESARRRCMQISVGAGSIAALYGIAQWFHASFVVASKGEAFGTLGNPSYLALYLLFTIFLSHHLAERESKREVSIILYCAAAIQMIALLLTQVQAALLALVVGAAIAAYPYIRRHITFRRGVIAFIAAVALILLFFFSTSFTKLASLSEGSTSLSNRIAVWNITLVGIAEKPLIGHGANMFEPWYLTQKSSGAATLPTTDEAFDKPHNAFLESAFSYGIVGLMIYLFFIWQIMRRARRITALYAALCAYFVFLFFFFDTFASLLMFFLVAAILVAPPDTAREQKSLPLTFESIRYGVALIGLVSLFFIFHYSPLYSAYFANRFLFSAATTHAVDEKLKAQALHYHSFNAPFIERVIFITERTLKK